MAQPYLSIIIPAYNEAKRLPATLIDIEQRLRQAEFSYEILVVNDGSVDGTAEIVRKMCAQIPCLRLVDNAENRGKGAVVRQGMLLASGAIRLFTDADNSTSIDHFTQMIPLLKAGYGVVICSRVIDGSVLDPPQPWYRQLLGKLGNRVIQVLLLPGIGDTQCGFKAFTEDAARRTFSLCEVRGWGFDAEVLRLAKALGYRIGQVPVHWRAQGGSKVGSSAYLQVLLDSVRVRWRLSVKHYKIAPD